jgi:diaminopimelate decarboxylase
MAKNGFIVTRVEYTKVSGGRHIATTHAGAQIITRTAFLPQSWPIRVAGVAPDGTARTGNPVETDAAGPCCFAADLIAKEITIPRLEPDDYVIVYDTGAYYFSNHFDYNSLPRVAVYAASGGHNNIELKLIRRGETLADAIRNMS